jgi:hypothetical protein
LATLGIFLENDRSSLHFCATVSHGYGSLLILVKQGLGKHCGRFFHKLVCSPCVEIIGYITDHS